MSSATPSDGDRNLLFGILAVQLGFVSRDALIEAMNAWVLDRGSRLAEILVKRGALAPAHRTMLEALVAEHLKLHGGDPIRSLAAVESASSIRASLASRVDDPLVQASLIAARQARADEGSRIAAGSEGVDSWATRPPSTADGAGLGRRFRILRPHAEGGLGAVFVAVDDELNREVALKQIKPAAALRADARARFLLEAEITGGLEHPGIVPVYSLGHAADGQPFYAMRFIRGDSLGEAIQRFHRKRGASGSRADDNGTGSGAIARETSASLEFRGLIRRLIDVCNAVAYAHSRGVLHRDLKPGNIMLGKYGETLVVDWGLAKPSGTVETMGGVDVEQGLQPSSASGTPETLPGLAIGTPQFMPPEQAAGRLELLGPRSDVYSLGATLYAIVTGRPPVEGKDLGEILRRVQAGDVTPPRSHDASILRPLEAICLKAMALRPEERYESAQSLAEDLEHWLADEPVSAYAEPWHAKAGRWMRRHRTLATSTAAALAIGVIGLSAFAVVLGGKNRALAEERNRAVEREDLAIKAVKRFGDVVTEAPELRDTPALAPLRKKLLQEPLGFFRTLRDQMQARPDTRPAALARLAEATFSLGYLTDQIGDQEDALRAYEESLAIRERLAREHPNVIAYQSDLAQSHDHIGSLQSDTGRPADALDSYGKARAIVERLARENPTVTEHQRRLAVSYNNTGVVQEKTGRLADALHSYGKALAIQERLAREHPTVTVHQSDLARSQFNIAGLQSQTGRLADALASYGKALAIRERLARENPTVSEFQSDLAVSHNNIGSLQNKTGRPTDALDSYEKARAIREQLARAHPTVIAYQRELAASDGNLGSLQSETGRPADALVSYRKALTIREQLARENPTVTELQSDLAASHNNIGLIQSETGQPADALDSYAKALAIREQLARKNPTVTAYQSDLATLHNNIGNLERETGRPADALNSHGKALAILERLAREHPTVTEYQNDLVLSHINIGFVQSNTGRQAEALDSYGKALAISEGLAREHPTVTEYQRHRAGSHVNIGLLQREAGRPADALDSFGKALTIRERLARENPTVTAYQSDLAMNHNNIGVLQNETGRPADALNSHGKALAIQERLAREHPTFTEYQHSLAASHNNIGLIQRKTGRPADALESYAKALAIQERLAKDNPASPEFASLVGATLSNIGAIDLDQRRPVQARSKLKRAIKEQKRALAPDPRDPTYRQFLDDHLYNLIKAAKALGNDDEAAAAQRELDALKNGTWTLENFPATKK